MTKDIRLDAKDEEIVRQFQRNGRLSNRAVGEHVGLSEGAVRKRLRRLTDAAAISYGTIVDIEATGMGVSGYLGLEVAPHALQAIADHVGGLQACTLCMITTGKVNIRAYLYDKDQVSLSRTTAALAALDGVIKVEFRESVYFTQHRFELIMMPDN